MNKTLPTLRYLLKGFSGLTIIALLSILANVVVTDLVFYLTDRNNPTPSVVPLTAPVEVTAGIFALLTGMILFLINFRVALANGVSRKTFLQANLMAAALMAAALGSYNIVVLLVHRLFWPLILVSHLTFPTISLAGLLLVQFAQYLLYIVAGWLISLAYYRGSVAVRWAISLAPFIGLGLYLTANAQTGGATGAAIKAFWDFTMRSSPAMAITTLLVYAACLYGLVYLLLRRAPLKG
jgi:hypothetical protein